MKDILDWSLIISFYLVSQGAWGAGVAGAQLESSIPIEYSLNPLTPGANTTSPLHSLPTDKARLIRFEDISLVSYLEQTHHTRNSWPFGKLNTNQLTPGSGEEPSAVDIGFVARGFYLNDQRIQWSGLEATFAGEGAAYAGYRMSSGGWNTSVEIESFINQPADKNILLDTQERRSYAANYDFDTFELSRLNISVRRGDWEVRVGKMWSPFGRYYSQLWSNQFVDAPFIRTEAIRWRETGALLRWDPGIWVLETGLFNGHLNRDANSSKALVARVGAGEENWAVGASIKAHDGSGSEQQKTYSNHAGIDAMMKIGPWRLSSEVIYDQYGLRRPTFDPLDIFWEKSIYYRDLNKALAEPITGVGYYATLDFEGERWLVSLNYGQFFPENIGDIRHDRTQNRGIIKLARSLGSSLQVFTVVLIENEGYIAQEGRPRSGKVLLTGVQFTH